MPDKKKAIGKLKKDNISKSPKGTNYLLTIGIDDYEHCPKLNNAVKDTRDIANVLFEKYNFEEKNHLKLENKEATLDNIIALFRKIKNKATEKDNVLIYYSGHGKLNEDEESFWIPVEARENKEGDFISVDKLFRLIKVIKSHHILLILDSCFSGSMLSANTSRSLNKNETQPSRYGIASGRRELVSDGKPGANSPFADSLIKKLKINSESLGASDLAQQVMHLTKDATNQNQVPLHGRMRITGDKLGEFFFHPKEENKEASLWESVVMGNTIHAYDDYLEKFPNGKYADEAEQRMENLEHEETWQKIKGNHSIVSYRKYLRRYSKGKYRADAQAAIQKIKSGEEKIDEPIEEQVPVKTKVIKPLAQIIETPNTFTDPRDGQTYKTVELKDGNIWMAENFNFDTGEDCYFYNNDAKNGKKYGRLYTWDAAVKACPEGWRLPNNKEWEKMLNHYGGFYHYKDSNSDGESAYNELIDGGESHLKILLGGYRDLDEEIGFAFLGKSGLFWSGKSHYNNGAFGYHFDKEHPLIGRGKYMRNHAYSCRYIKISDKEKSSKKKTSKIIQPTPHIIKDPNLFTDPRDGQTYKTAKLIDGNIWMTQNFNFDTGKDCWHFDNDSKHGKQYGRLYTLDAAQKACPEGWHIPSDEEWWNLANHYDMPFNVDEGKPRNENSNAGSAGYKALTKGGSSSLEISFSGLKMIDGDFVGLGKFGNYWSSTNSFDVHFFYYNFSSNGMRRGVLPKRIANSCRYIKDSDGKKPLRKKTSKIKKTKANIIKPTSKIIKGSNFFKDPRDGQTYNTAKLKDGKIWMTQNLNFKLPKQEVGRGFILKTKTIEEVCWDYDNANKNGKKYGKLYTWDAAMKACPPGWHLPSNEEWSNMIKHYDDQDLFKGGNSEFSAQLGGMRESDGEFKDLGEYGHYWTSGYIIGFGHAYYYWFNKNIDSVTRIDVIKTTAFSCRCVKD